MDATASLPEKHLNEDDTINKDVSVHKKVFRLSAWHFSLQLHASSQHFCRLHFVTFICFKIQIGKKDDVLYETENLERFFVKEIFLCKCSSLAFPLECFSALALRIHRCIHAHLVGPQMGTESLKSSKNSQVTKLKVNALNNVQLLTLSCFLANSSVRVYDLFFFSLTAQKLCT